MGTALNETTGLPLADPRWATLQTRNGYADWVPEWLQKIADRPLDIALFSDEWPELCSEGTTWPAAYAAFPYLVQIAARVAPKTRLEYATVFGLVLINEVPAEAEISAKFKKYLAEKMRKSMPAAIPLVAEILTEVQSDERDLRYVFMSIAALNRHHLLAECIDRLDDDEFCPRYAESLNE